MEDTFRKEYTKLTEDQVKQMAAAKEAGQELLNMFNLCVPKDERSERNRCMAIARTQLELSIMMAVKAITTKIDG